MTFVSRQCHAEYEILIFFKKKNTQPHSQSGLPTFARTSNSTPINPPSPLHLSHPVPSFSFFPPSSICIQYIQYQTDAMHPPAHSSTEGPPLSYPPPHTQRPIHHRKKRKIRKLFFFSSSNAPPAVPQLEGAKLPPKQKNTKSSFFFPPSSPLLLSLNFFLFYFSC